MNNTYVVEDVLNEMGKVVKVSRKIVRIASSEHEAGWRYGYEDTMVEGEHSLYEGEVAVDPEPETKPEINPAVSQKKAKQQLEGWGENA